MKTELPKTGRHCGYCGHPIAADAAPAERFGERFCSDAHAEEFVAGVRAARTEAVAARERDAAPGPSRQGAACGLLASAGDGRRGLLKRAACWGTPLLILLAMPLVWSGGWAAAGGSLLSVLALLACPLGMFFMMRAMMKMQRPRDQATTPKGEDHA
jgi:hypothetical protein